MIPVDLSANCEGWIYDSNGYGIQVLELRSQDPFSGSTPYLSAMLTGRGERGQNHSKVTRVN